MRLLVGCPVAVVKGEVLGSPSPVNKSAARMGLYGSGACSVVFAILQG